MNTRIPHDPPLSAYSPEDITALLEDACATRPPDDPWRRALEAFDEAERQHGRELVERAREGDGGKLEGADPDGCDRRA